MEIPKVEVRYENITISTNVKVGSRALPTLLNFGYDVIEVLNNYLIWFDDCCYDEYDLLLLIDHLWLKCSLIYIYISSVSVSWNAEYIRWTKDIQTKETFPYNFEQCHWHCKTWKVIFLFSHYMYVTLQSHSSHATSTKIGTYYLLYMPVYLTADHIHVSGS